MVFRVHEESSKATPVIDVDGSYQHRKALALLPSVTKLPPPTFVPLTGWEIVTINNVHEVNSNIPCVMPG